VAPDAASAAAAGPTDDRAAASAGAWSSALTSPEAFAASDAYAQSGAAPTAPARLPRGAFLWPAGSVAAMGLRALSSEGYAGLPVVALELLAAQAVAELGTWVTAFPGANALGARAGGFAPYADDAFTPGTAGLPYVTAGGAASTPGGAAYVDAAGRPLSSLAAQVAASRAAGAAPVGESAQDDAPGEVADAAAWFTSSVGDSAPARARFEQVYIALAQSTEGQSLSPSARAARAMSLLARSDDSQKLTTRERAQAAWSMLPGVYNGSLDVVAGERAARGEEVSGLVDTRPGLAGLASRAGEALGSFVNPSAEAVQGLSRSSDAGSSSAAARASAPVYVENNQRVVDSAQAQSVAAARAGRTFSQVGGGEAEIPSWFESAARRMFADTGGNASGSAGMSIAQMVLVTSMPAQQVAAATRGASAGGTGAPGGGGGKGGAAVDKPDVDQLAHEVYQEVMKLIDVARERSGDPYQ